MSAIEKYVYSAGRRLRCGYTTGSCAAAAAKAAALILLSRCLVEAISIDTPKGIRLTLAVEDAHCGADFARCAVRKDAGDDVDATDGILVYATVRLTNESAILVDGGEGVGRVTRDGLEQPVGVAAINRVPREMIAREVRRVLEEYDSLAGASVEISIPAGVEIAKKTYNPRLGIVGGISVLGTTGIVEPMSETALIDSIRVEMDVLKASGVTDILITPGNYGEVFARETMGLDLSKSVLCSNFIGDALDYAVQLGFSGILLVGHIGKLVKLAGGVFQTHSRVADARMEIIAAHAALAGADREVICAIMESITTDEAIDCLENAGILNEVMQSILQKMNVHLNQRTGGITTGAVVFSNARGILGQTPDAAPLIDRLRKTEEPA